MPPSEGHLTTQEGIRLFFRTLGNGPKTAVIPNGIHLFDDLQRLAEGRTLIFYDLRNRGRSDQVSDVSKLKGGIQNDVDDLEAVRRHFGIDRIDLIGHSYLGITVILYAMKYPGHVGRVVQIGPMQPHHGKQYGTHIKSGDETLRQVLAQLEKLQPQRESLDPVEFCRRFWSVLRLIYVTDPADAHRIDWGRCTLKNELNFMKYWLDYVLPSIQKLSITAEELARTTMPVLTLHGTKDRSAPYGGGRDWASMLPNARLVTVENAGHAPWIEAPDEVFGSIRTFLHGNWPESAQKVDTLDPGF